RLVRRRNRDRATQQPDGAVQVAADERAPGRLLEALGCGRSQGALLLSAGCERSLAQTGLLEVIGNDLGELGGSAGATRLEAARGVLVRDRALRLGDAAVGRVADELVAEEEHGCAV